MKRTFLTLGAALAITTAGLGAAHAASAPASSASVPKDACSDKKSKFAHDACEKEIHSAPGDEYFGRMKMSYLGINNTFHDEAIRAGAYTTDSGLINKVNFADEALQQWTQRYPGDPQLARSYFLAIQVYKKIYTKDAQDRAWSYMNLLVRKFPTSYFGKLEKKDLQIGFTEHYFANPQLCPTPEPTPTATPKGAKPSPTPTLNTEPVPTQSPTPTPKPGSPKVEIIQPPCIQPSPAPTPTTTPSPTTTHKPN